MTPVQCRDCPARFVWGKTTKGQLMPLDASRDEATGRWAPTLFADGNIEPTGDTAFGRDGVRIPVVRNLGPNPPPAMPGLSTRWRSHFASCPKAKENRRKPRRRAGARATGRRQWER